MMPKEKAKELYEMFQVYYWHQEDGYMPDDIETKNIIEKVCDELIYSHSQDTTDNQYYFWVEVKQEIEKI